MGVYMTDKKARKEILEIENKLDDLYSTLYKTGYRTLAEKIGIIQYKLMDIRTGHIEIDK